MTVIPIPEIKMQVRAIAMLAALEKAGASPIEVPQFHAFAFFANVLSPVWELEPVKGSVLKRKSGPFYPELQESIEVLIAKGVVVVERLRYEPAENGSRLAASIRIDLRRAQPVLSLCAIMPDEMKIALFLEELAFVFVEIEPASVDEAVEVDATYSAPTATEDRVVDFAEWQDPAVANFSVRAARRLQAHAPEGVSLSRAEELVLYMRLMKRRVAALGG